MSGPRGQGPQTSSEHGHAPQAQHNREREQQLNTGTGCGKGPCGGCDKCATKAKELAKKVLESGSVDALIADVKAGNERLGHALPQPTQTTLTITGASGSVSAVDVSYTPPTAVSADTTAASLAATLRGNPAVAAVVPASAISNAFPAPAAGSPDTLRWTQASASSNVVISIGRVPPATEHTRSESPVHHSQQSSAKRYEQSLTQERVPVREAAKVTARTPERDVATKAPATSASRESTPVAVRESTTITSDRSPRSAAISTHTSEQGATASKAAARVEVQKVVESLLRAEQAVQAGALPESVAQALQRLSSTMVKAAPSSPALEASAKQAGLLARAITNSPDSDTVSIKVVQAQLSAIREVVTRTVASMTGITATNSLSSERARTAGTTSSTQSPREQTYNVHQGRNGATITTRMPKTATSSGTMALLDRQVRTRAPHEARPPKEPTQTPRALTTADARAKEPGRAILRTNPPTSLRAVKIQSVRANPMQGIRERLHSLRERLQTRRESQLESNRQRSRRDPHVTPPKGPSSDVRTTRRFARDGESLRPSDVRARIGKERALTPNTRQTRGERSSPRTLRVKEGIVRKNSSSHNQRVTSPTGRRALSQATATLRQAIQKLRASRRAAKDAETKTTSADSGSRATRVRPPASKSRHVRGERAASERGADGPIRDRATQRTAPPRNTLEKSSTRHALNQRVSERERSVQRKKDPSLRSTEAALQNEIAISVRRAVKKLLRGEEEELLRLLSPMEQRLIDEISQGIDAATTIADIQKSLKKARAKGGSKPGATTEGATQETQGAGQNQSAAQGSSQGATSIAEQQPSRSLDLVTGRVDDGDNKNGYEAAL